VNGCECFDPNDTSPHCANSPIRPPTPPPTTAEDAGIGGGATADAAGSGASSDDVVIVDTPSAAPPADVSSGGVTSPPGNLSFGVSFDDDPEEGTPPPEAGDVGQDTITIIIGGSPAVPTSTTADAASPFIFLDSSVKPGNHGSLDGVELGPKMTSSSTANAVPYKWFYSLMQSSLLVTSWI
jgi:hypothetical protein